MRRYLFVFALGIVLPIAALFLMAWSGLLPFRATARPSGIEAAIAMRALDARLDREARGLKNPLKATNEVLLAGMKRYRNGCAGCHGSPGSPSAWGTKDFYPPVPQFADDPPDMPAPQMFLVVKHGIRYTGMGGSDGLVKDEDIWTVVTFLSHIHDLPPSVTAAWTARTGG